MTIITTNGDISSVLVANPQVLGNAATDVTNEFGYSFVQAAYDFYYGNYNSDPSSNSQFDTYLYGAQGFVSMTGLGFLGTSGKISQIQFTGDYGLSWGVSGSINWNLDYGITSVHLHSMNASYSGDQISMAGNIAINGSGISGSLTQTSITADGITMGFTGSISLSSGTGNYKSLDLNDASGGINIKGNFPVGGALDNELASATTFDDLFNSPTLLVGNDTFNVPDASREWHGYGGADKMTGGASGDRLYGDDGNDKLYGLGGNDYLDGGSGNNSIDGGVGDNTIVAGDGNNKIIAGAGGDNITTGIGSDNISAGDGDNVINAGAGNNKIVTGLGIDTITVGAGNDNISAGAGDNHIDAGDGANRVVTLAGNDTIATGLGNDNISAGDGINTIEAGAGNDKVVTGSGNDIINGGEGADKLTGGAGSDHFVFDNLASGGYDTITDFLKLEDVLVFEDSVFTALTGGVTSDNLVIGTGVTAVAQDVNDYLIFDTNGGKLYYDADGNGAGATIQIATLSKVTDLTVTNIEIV